MIYLDPPYGIRFGSNFQTEVGEKGVGDKLSDLTREPEMIKAYRDTWTLGLHSYLTYLRDRLTMCWKLLSQEVYRPRFLGHRVEPYAALATG
jgi:adenine-specific DNA-methyltransferase